MYQAWIGFLFWAALLCLPFAATAENANQSDQQNEAFRHCVLEKSSWEACYEVLDENDPVRKSFKEEDITAIIEPKWRWGGIWSPTLGELILKKHSG